MRISLYLTGIFCCLILISQNLFSQVVNIGVSGGINRFSHNSDNANFYLNGTDIITPSKFNDDRFTFTCGIVTEIIPSITGNSAFQVRVSYNSYSFKSDFKEINNNRTDVMGKLLQNPDPIIQDTNRTFLNRNEFILRSISVDLLYKYKIVDNLSIVAGTKLNNYINTEVITTQSLINPFWAQFKREEGKVYTDNDRTIVVYKEKEIKDFSLFNLGLSLGLQYSFKCKGFDLNPFVIYDIYFTELMLGKGWKLTSYNMGVDFMFSF